MHLCLGIWAAKAGSKGERQTAGEMDIGFRKWPVELTPSDQTASITTVTELIYLKKSEFTLGSETLNTEHLKV